MKIRKTIRSLAVAAVLGTPALGTVALAATPAQAWSCWNETGYHEQCPLPPRNEAPPDNPPAQQEPAQEAPAQTSGGTTAKRPSGGGTTTNKQPATVITNGSSPAPIAGQGDPAPVVVEPVAPDNVVDAGCDSVVAIGGAVAC